MYLAYTFCLCRAIQASLAHLAGSSSPPQSRDPPDGAEALDPDLQLALMLSQQDQDQSEQQRLEEEKLLEQILKLSMTEK